MGGTGIREDEYVAEDERETRYVGTSLVARVKGGREPAVSVEYSEEIRRLAYEIWLLKADRNVARTARMLVDELRDELPSYPTDRQIRNWRKEEAWEARAQDDIKQVAQMLNERHFLRLFAASEQAGSDLVSIAQNDHPEKDARRLQVIKDANVELLKLRGLGTAGGYAPPAIPHATVRLGEQGETAQELSRAIREAILSDKKQLGQGKRRG
jgi:hypothetical protein